MISQELIDKNKARLEEEKTRLEKLLSNIADKNENVKGDYKARFPEVGDDSDENASEVAQYEANLAEEQDLETKLQKVTAALERIAQGSYGVCVEGGEEIRAERLEAVPEADTCIEHG